MGWKDILKKGMAKVQEKSMEAKDKIEESGVLSKVTELGSKNDDPMVKLKKLKEMLDMEIITQEDFDVKKKDILAEM